MTTATHPTPATLATHAPATTALTLATLTTLALAATAHAQQPLIPDRPDFTEGTSTVGRGVIQIEFGYTLELLRGDGASVQAHSLGEPLLRLGILADWLEFRVAASPVAQRTTLDGTGHSDTGLEDLYLGIKLALSDQNGIVPALAILPQTTLPTGTDGFSDDRALPGVNLLYSWDIGDAFSLSGSTQINRSVNEPGDAVADWAQSLSGGFVLGDRHGLYGEWFAIFHEGADGREAEHYVNAGLTWLVTGDLQWDIRAGTGLNNSAEDLFVGTGLSVRIR